MQFLLHGMMTPAVADALKRHGHHTHLPDEAGLSADSSLGDVLKAAQEKQFDLVTLDERMATAPFAMDFWFQRSLVYLQLTGGDVEQDDAIDRLFERFKRLTPGRLYTVTENRVKVRQLPSRK